MDVRGKVVVVTGGASGIGAALCRRFSEEGARAVVVADLDADGAEGVAREIGGRAEVCDVSVADAVARLAATTRDRFGEIDLFCSNAGVVLAPSMGEDDWLAPLESENAWHASWNVNLMAHVHAARAVLPSMLARGSGALLNTASAAGLLSDISAAAYSVTKHAAVAFAEWLSITYGDRGIRVHCLCPQGVRTPMLMGAASSGDAGHLTAGMIEPEDVASAVIEGLARDEFLILPHPEVRDYFARRASDPDRWLRGMRRMRARMLQAKRAPTGGS